MSYYTIGIDPGVNGAISLLKDSTILQVQDIPSQPKTTGKGKEINSVLLNSIIQDLIAMEPIDTVVFETVRAMPGQGSVSMFSFGRSVGTIEGILVGNGLPIVMVTPQKWKKYFGLIKKSKEASLSLILQRYPQYLNMFKLKKHVDRADATLMALWYYETQVNK